MSLTLYGTAPKYNPGANQKGPSKADKPFVERRSQGDRKDYGCSGKTNSFPAGSKRPTPPGIAARWRRCFGRRLTEPDIGRVSVPFHHVRAGCSMNFTRSWSNIRRSGKVPTTMRSRRRPQTWISMDGTSRPSASTGHWRRLDTARPKPPKYWESAEPRCGESSKDNWDRTETKNCLYNKYFIKTVSGLGLTLMSSRQLAGFHPEMALYRVFDHFWIH